MVSLLRLFPLLVFLSVCHSEVIMRARWKGAFKATVIIPIRKYIDGWNMTLNFNEPVSYVRIWRAKPVSNSDDGLSWNFVSRIWNPRQYPGSALKLSFIAYTKSGDVVPNNVRVVVLFNGELVPEPAATVAPSTMSQSRTGTTPSGPKYSPLSTEEPRFVVKITSTWPGFFKGYMKIPITRGIKGGWNMTMSFDVPVYDLQVPHAVHVRTSSDFKVHEVRHRQWNEDLDAGRILHQEFIGMVGQNGRPPKEIGVKFNGVTLQTGGELKPTPPTISVKPTPGGLVTTRSPLTGKPTGSNTTPRARPTSGAQSTRGPHLTGNPATTNVKPTTGSPSGTGVPTAGQTYPTEQPRFTSPIGTDEPGLKISTVMTVRTTQGPGSPSPIPKPKYDYKEVLEKSILFYEAQRSGKLPPDNRIPWRGDSALQDGQECGVDLSGGWYDAGDNVKFNFPMASSTTVLLAGLLEFKDAYIRSGQYTNMLNSVRWPLDYFLKCHIKDNELYGQVGKGSIDHAEWTRPEDMKTYRPCYKIGTGKPGSDLAAETAAAMAAGYLVFENVDKAYAMRLLDHAKKLFAFADNFRGKYSDSISDASSFYLSTGYLDELCWSATWLYEATQDPVYLEKAKKFYKDGNLGDTPWAFSWDQKNAGCQLMLAKLTKEASYVNDLITFLDSWLPAGSVPYTPKGLAWRSGWGSLRYSADVAFIALMADDLNLAKDKNYREFARHQIHYMLGDSGRSFVVGFGNNPPLRAHHKAASCPSSGECGWARYNSQEPNPHVLYGALVGGPDQNDRFEDIRSNYKMTEVACDYNAGFQSSIAGLLKLHAKGKL